MILTAFLWVFLLFNEKWVTNSDEYNFYLQSFRFEVKCICLVTIFIWLRSEFTKQSCPRANLRSTLGRSRMLRCYIVTIPMLYCDIDYMGEGESSNCFATESRSFNDCIATKTLQTVFMNHFPHYRADLCLITVSVADSQTDQKWFISQHFENFRLLDLQDHKDLRAIED